MSRPTQLEAVLFDFDGVICDTERENLPFVQSILRDMGADIPFEVIETLKGGDDLRTVPPLMERYGATGTIEDFMAIRDDCYHTYGECDLVVEPGVRELVNTLRKRGVRTAIVSTTVSRCILTALNRLGLTSSFDAVVCGDHVRHRKPAPEPYLVALDLLGVDADNAIVIDDSVSGIAAGKAAGCHVIAYTGCADTGDLSAADEIVDSFVGLVL